MAFGVVIVLILAGVAYVGWITLWPPKTSEPASGEGVAEIENVTGKVSVRLRSNASWEKGKEGMKLYAGDLIQTGSSGVAQLRFLHGPSISVPSDTMFSIRHVEDKAGKSLPPLSLASRPVSLAAEKPAPTPVPEKQKPLPEVPTKVAEPVKQPEPPPKAIPLPEPTLELDRIVPFGRSLELVGRVDPGNKLLVNSEVVRVESDGSFKHFTKPFATSGTVQLVLKTTDLAGRVRTLTRTATIH
jgi:hypothetical protein